MRAVWCSAAAMLVSGCVECAVGGLWQGGGDAHRGEPRVSRGGWGGCCTVFEFGMGPRWVPVVVLFVNGSDALMLRCPAAGGGGC